MLAWLISALVLFSTLESWNRPAVVGLMLPQIDVWCFPSQFLHALDLHWDAPCPLSTCTAVAQPIPVYYLSSCSCVKYLCTVVAEMFAVVTIHAGRRVVWAWPPVVSKRRISSLLISSPWAVPRDVVFSACILAIFQRISFHVLSKIFYELF